jgi:hypothetical protein
MAPRAHRRQAKLPDLLRRTRVLIPSINLKRLCEQDQRR